MDYSFVLDSGQQNFESELEIMNLNPYIYAYANFKLF